MTRKFEQKWEKFRRKEQRAEAYTREMNARLDVADAEREHPTAMTQEEWVRAGLGSVSNRTEINAQSS